MNRFFTISLFAMTVTLGWMASGVSKEKVLYLGGSHSLGPYGFLIDSDLRERGFDVISVVDGEAGPYHWLKAYQSFSCVGGYWYKTGNTEKRIAKKRNVPKLETLLAQHQPNIVVIQTEWNLYATLRSPRRKKEDNRTEVRFLIDQMCRTIKTAGAKAYWILPPHSHERRHSNELQEELKTIMTSVIADHGFEFFDSSKITRFTEKYPETDGVTYDDDQYLKWANNTLSDLSTFIKTTQQHTSKTPLRPIRPLAATERKKALEPVPQLDPESDIETDE